MPGWQEFYSKHKNDGFELVTVAMDIQGPDVVRPWIEKANAEYTALVDVENKFGSYFSYNFVPLTMLFDESGKLVRGPQSANVANPKLIEELEDWFENGENSVVARNAMEINADIERNAGNGFASKKAEELFHDAVSLLGNNEKENALGQLHSALEFDPDNYLIRKQIWALENPEKFYEGDIDVKWQREIMRKKK